ncbi:MAG: type III secretion system export apparatus subunit SctV [Deltaproteobacteria bacterium]
MKALRKSLRAIPLDAPAKHADVTFAVAIGCILAMMILPLPAPLLDGLLALNLALAAVVLVAVLLSDKPLSISTFPSLLLVTTLFRLSLNVSTTRMILSRGTAGEVVQAFGAFVVQGDLIVGIVIFLVITLVQFLVIGKGAERVAEVGARFTLDAMPGKQMSIDAALRSGAIDDDEAQAQRDELGRESQFYGAMDGAMKFIKGDAIAGLIITALNLVAGLVIGAMRNGMPVSEAAEVYSLLTVGDGLVSQIPALLITLSAGILTTRVASKQPQSSLGDSLRSELFTSPKVLALGAFFSAVLAVVPGLPAVPFLAIATAFGAAAIVLRRRRDRPVAAKDESFESRLAARVEQAKAQKNQMDQMAPTVVPVMLDLSPELTTKLGFGVGKKDADTMLIGELFPELRKFLHAQSGVRFPGIRVRTHVPGLPAGSFVVRLRDVPVFDEVLPLGKCLALESPEKLARLGVTAEPYPHPLSGAPCAFVDERLEAKLEAAGVLTMKIDGIVSMTLGVVLSRNARNFIGLQETSELVDRLAKVCPTLVQEVVPKIVSLTQLTDILRRLVDEDVSIRDLKGIVEALAEFGPHESDGVLLTEYVRSALSQQIAYGFVEDGQLNAVLLDGEIEDIVRSAICHIPSGSYLALDPVIQRAILTSISRTLRPVLRMGRRPVLLTTSDVRRYVRRLVEVEFPALAVLSVQELPPTTAIQPLGRASLPEELPSAA